MLYQYPLGDSGLTKNPGLTWSAPFAPKASLDVLSHTPVNAVDVPIVLLYDSEVKYSINVVLAVPPPK